MTQDVAPRLREFINPHLRVAIGYPSPWLLVLYLRNGSHLFPLYGFSPRFAIGFQWNTTYGAWFVTRRARRWLKLYWLIRRVLRKVAVSV